MAVIGMVNPLNGMEAVPSYDNWKSNRFSVTSYGYTGPTTGSNGVATSPFTVVLPSNLVLAQPVTITPADGGGGSFTPSTVRLTDVDRSATFTYTLVGTGSKTISVTNNQGLTNPSSIVCVIS